jgi:hypothetical protein
MAKCESQKSTSAIILGRREYSAHTHGTCLNHPLSSIGDLENDPPLPPSLRAPYYKHPGAI